ncbi:hypothetical protein MXB_2915, partial [Myxobolus squamalis]
EKVKNLLKYSIKIYYQLLEHVKDFGPGCVLKQPYSKTVKQRHSCAGIGLEILMASLMNLVNKERLIAIAHDPTANIYVPTVCRRMTCKKEYRYSAVLHEMFFS